MRWTLGCVDFVAGVSRFFFALVGNIVAIESTEMRQRFDREVRYD
ncbi:MAG: hypothetical protein ACK52S_11150 [Pirellula sp.]|jgi:hypothetical protein